MSAERNLPAIFLVFLELIALAAACYGYFTEASGTAGTGGALLVIVSSVLILGATILTEFDARLAAAIHTILEALLVLGFAGTTLAAWLLMNWMLLAAMVVAFLLWLALRLGFAPARTAKLENR